MITIAGKKIYRKLVPDDANAPTQQATIGGMSSPSFNSITISSLTYSGANGVIVFVKNSTGSGFPLPIDGVVYTPDTVYGNGSLLNGYYCVLRAASSSVTVGGTSGCKGHTAVAFSYNIVNGTYYYNTRRTYLNCRGFATRR